MQTPIMERDEFNAWISSIDDELEELESAVGFPLDFTPASIIGLERELMACFADYGDMQSKMRNDDECWLFVDRCARYVGEYLCKALPNAKWRLSDGSGAGQPLPGMPEVFAIDDSWWPISPHSWIGAAVDRREGAFLISSVHSWMD